MAVKPEGQTPVIFAWGSSVFACTDQRWELILHYVATKDPRLDETVDRCQRLSNRPLVQLGVMSRDEAEARLAARKTALAGTLEAPPPVVRQRGQPPKFSQK
jgi:hypothetical protein